MQNEITIPFKTAFNRLETLTIDQEQVSQLKKLVLEYINGCLSGVFPIEIAKSKLQNIVKTMRGIDSFSNHGYLNLVLQEFKTKLQITQKDEFPTVDSTVGNSNRDNLLNGNQGKHHKLHEEKEDTPEQRLKALNADPSPLFKEIHSITKFDHIKHVYDDAEVEEIHEEFFPTALQEHLTRQERARRRAKFIRSEPKRERAKKLALKRLSSTANLSRKARKLAVSMIKEKISHKKISELSPAEKDRLEDLIKRNPNLINRLSAKLVPKIKKIEQERIKNQHLKEEVLNEIRLAPDISHSKDDTMGYDNLFFRKNLSDI